MFSMNCSYHFNLYSIFKTTFQWNTTWIYLCTIRCFCILNIITMWYKPR